MEKQNFYWAPNLKFLRNRKKISQENLADQLEISRSKLVAHENGQTINPPVGDLIKFSDYFKISIDSLVKVNLSKLPELKLRELEAGNDVYVNGSKIRVLAIATDQKNRENITYVPIKAKAGYMAGYSDPSYIESLPNFNLPHLTDKRTYRMFPTEGNSMLPIPENSLILTTYVEDWSALKGISCIVILKNEQDFLFKNVTYLAQENGFLLHSLNAEYADKIVFAGDVLEVWKYQSHITDVIPSSDSLMQQLIKTVNEIKVDMNTLKRERK